MKEKSYMIAIPEKQEDLEDVAVFLTRLCSTSGIELVSHGFEEVLKLVLKVEGKEYEVWIEPEEIEIPAMFRAQHLFPDVDIEKVENARAGLGVGMEFSEDVLASYHAQLKIVHALLPEAVAVLDASSEKILSGKWVALAAASKVAPAPRYIYTVQAVGGEDDCVWLHSHGMNRCGMPELEILNSTKEMYQTHYNILETLANRLLEFTEVPEPGEPIYLARVTEKIPLYVTMADWKEAVAQYPKEMLGGEKDRVDSHNENTCGIFVYPTYEALQNREYAPIRVFDKLLKENPIYMISTKETERMKRLAKERLPYMLKSAENPDYKILVKIGLDIDEEFREQQNQFEHIWFELLEVSEHSLRGRLIQEPYYVKSMHEGSEGSYPLEKITDWCIYTKNGRLTPDDAYLME